MSPLDAWALRRLLGPARCISSRSAWPDPEDSDLQSTLLERLRGQRTDNTGLQEEGHPATSSAAPSKYFWPYPMPTLHRARYEGGNALAGGRVCVWELTPRAG